MPKQSQFDNVVAQLIGRLCLMNQATTKSGGEATDNDIPFVIARHFVPKQSHAPPRLPRFARNDN